MSTQRILGIVLLIVGVIFLIMGMNSSHSMADQVNNTFTGRFTERTTWYIIGGIALALLGLVMALFTGGRRRMA
jgi:drug/metabolite transporter (DMT)-like permease